MLTEPTGPEGKFEAGNFAFLVDRVYSIVAQHFPRAVYISDPSILGENVPEPKLRSIIASLNKKLSKEEPQKKVWFKDSCAVLTEGEDQPVILTSDEYALVTGKLSVEAAHYFFGVYPESNRIRVDGKRKEMLIRLLRFHPHIVHFDASSYNKRNLYALVLVLNNVLSTYKGAQIVVKNQIGFGYYLEIG